MNKTILAIAIASTTLVGCGDETNAIDKVTLPGENGGETITPEEPGDGDYGEGGSESTRPDKDDDLIIIVPPSGDGSDAITPDPDDGDSGTESKPTDPDSDISNGKDPIIGIPGVPGDSIIPGTDYDNDFNVRPPIVVDPDGDGTDTITPDPDEGDPGTPPTNPDEESGIEDGKDPIIGIPGVPGDEIVPGLDYDSDMNIDLVPGKPGEEPTIPGKPGEDTIYTKIDFGDRVLHNGKIYVIVDGNHPVDSPFPPNVHGWITNEGQVFDDGDYLGHIVGQMGVEQSLVLRDKWDRATPFYIGKDGTIYAGKPNDKDPDSDLTDPSLPGVDGKPGDPTVPGTDYDNDFNVRPPIIVDPNPDGGEDTITPDPDEGESGTPSTPTDPDSDVGNGMLPGLPGKPGDETTPGTDFDNDFNVRPPIVIDPDGDGTDAIIPEPPEENPGTPSTKPDEDTDLGNGKDPIIGIPGVPGDEIVPGLDYDGDMNIDEIPGTDGGDGNEGGNNGEPGDPSTPTDPDTDVGVGGTPIPPTDGEDTIIPDPDEGDPGTPSTPEDDDSALEPGYKFVGKIFPVSLDFNDQSVMGHKAKNIDNSYLFRSIMVDEQDAANPLVPHYEVFDKLSNEKVEFPSCLGEMQPIEVVKVEDLGSGYSFIRAKWLSAYGEDDYRCEYSGTSLGNFIRTDHDNKLYQLPDSFEPYKMRQNGQEIIAHIKPESNYSTDIYPIMLHREKDGTLIPYRMELKADKVHLIKMGKLPIAPKYPYNWMVYHYNSYNDTHYTYLTDETAIYSYENFRETHTHYWSRYNDSGREVGWPLIYVGNMGTSAMAPVIYQKGDPVTTRRLGSSPQLEEGYFALQVESGLNVYPRYELQEIIWSYGERGGFFHVSEDCTVWTNDDEYGRQKFIGGKKMSFQFKDDHFYCTGELEDNGKVESEVLTVNPSINTVTSRKVHLPHSSPLKTKFQTVGEYVYRHDAGSTTEVYRIDLSDETDDSERRFTGFYDGAVLDSMKVISISTK